MIEICFDTNAHAKLHFYKNEINDKIGDIVMFPDFICIGKINPFSTELRDQELKYFGIPNSKNYQRNWNLFFHKIQKENAFRFWISNYAYEFVGMCYICSIIQSQTISICNTNTIPSLSQYGTYELWTLDQYDVLFNNQYTDESIRYSNIWTEVSKENKPVRFTKDNKVISVDEEYFDSEIMKYIDSKKSNIDISTDALFDSEILKKSGLGTYFILHRVNILMKQGF